MADFEVQYSIVESFFDRASVERRVEKAEIKILSRIGAFIRTRTRTKVLRKRKKSAAPGEPPRVHTSDKVASLRNILFGYDGRHHSVVIGPVKLRGDKSMPMSVPHLMEFGGTLTVVEERHKRRTGKKKNRDNWYRFTGVFRAWKEYRTRVAVYPKHPFMAVGLEEERRAGTLKDAMIASIGG